MPPSCSPRRQQPRRSMLDRTRVMAGTYSGSSARCPGTTSVATGNRIQGRQHDLDLGQVRAVVLAMPKLEQPVFRHAPAPAGRGTIQAHALGLQIVHTQVLGEA